MTFDQPQSSVATGDAQKQRMCIITVLVLESRKWYPLGPLCCECAHHRPTPCPSLEMICRKALFQISRIQPCAVHTARGDELKGGPQVGLIAGGLPRTSLHGSSRFVTCTNSFMAAVPIEPSQTWLRVRVSCSGFSFLGIGLGVSGLAPGVEG